MPQYSITLQAGKAKRQIFGQSKYLTIADTGVAAGIDVDIEIAGFAQESLRGLQRRDRVETPGFEAASFTAAVDCTIQVIASIAAVSLNNSEGQAVQAFISGTVPVQVIGPDPLDVSVDDSTPINVHADRGDAPANPLYVTGLSLMETPAAHVTDGGPVAAGPAQVAVVPADATRLELIVYNQGPDPVALGMLGITWAKRAIVLSAGDQYIEARCAAQAWYAITDAAGAANITVQERKS